RFLSVRYLPPPPSTLFPYTTLFRSGRGPAAPPQIDQRTYRRELRRAVPRRYRADQGGDGRIIGISARPSFGRDNRDRCRRPRFRSEEHTSELQSRENLVCRLLLEKK